MKRILSILASLALVIGVTGCGEKTKEVETSVKEPITLRVAHNSTSLVNPYHVGLNEFAVQLEEISGGEMKAEVYPGTLGTNESELAMKLTTDTVDMVVAMPSFMSGTGVKEFDILSLYYLFDSFDEWEKVIDGEFGNKMKSLITEKSNNDFKIMGYYSSSVRSYYGKKPIINPEDAKGLNIRTQGSPVHHEFWKKLGANPISVGWQELYQALNTGTADAAENDYTNLMLKEHHKTPNGKHISVTNHNYTTVLLLMNGNNFDKYTEEQQEWIQKAADLSVRKERDITYEMLNESKEKILEDGGKINEVNIDAFKAIGQEIIDRFVKENNLEELFNLLEKSK